MRLTVSARDKAIRYCDADLGHRHGFDVQCDFDLDSGADDCVDDDDDGRGDSLCR